MSSFYLSTIQELKIEFQKKDRVLLTVKDSHTSSGIFIINDVAAEILKYINSPTSFTDLLEILAARYTDTIQNVEIIVDEFLDEIKGKYGINVTKVTSYQNTGKSVEVLRREQFYPLGALIEITSACNFKCLHCYGSFGEGNVTYISLKKMKELLTDLDNHGIVSLELTGGEITLHPNLYEILEFALSLNFAKIALLTNGLLLSDKILNLICRFKERFLIQIDIHGLTEEYVTWFTGKEGTLEIVKKKLVSLVQKGVIVRGATVVTRKNLCQVSTIADWLYSIGVSKYGVTLVTPIGRALEPPRDDLHLNSAEILLFNNILENIFKKYPGFASLIDEDYHSKNCGCLSTCVSISSSGNIKWCAMDDGTHCNSGIGNIYENTVSELYRKYSSYIEALADTEAPTESTIECQGCEHFAFCRGCLLRSIIRATQIGIKCKWYSRRVSVTVKEHIQNRK